MSLTAKFDQVKSVLGEFYGSTGAEDASDEVVEKIRKAGGVTEGLLQELSDRDIEATTGLPPAVCRQVARVLGAKVAEDGVSRQYVVVSNDPVSMALQLKPHELVEQYNENEPDSPIANRLRQLSGDDPFLVYNPDGTRNNEWSVKCLSELIAHYPPRKAVLVYGETLPTYQVGHQPEKWADEHPLYDGQMLRPDGFSDNNVPWGTISKEVHSLIRTAVASREVDYNAPEMRIFKDFDGRSLSEAGRLCPVAYIKWKELRSGNQEPKLKLPLKPRKKKAT